MSAHAQSEALARASRLFKIIMLVRSRREGERISRSALAQACDCSIKSIQRDIDLLTQVSPISYDTKAKSFVLPSKGWTYPVLSLAVEDALALTLVGTIAATSGFPEPALLTETLAKITSAFPPALKTVMDDAASGIVAGQSSRDYSNSPLQVVRRAQQTRETLEIDYNSRSSGERSWRRIDPYQIEQRRGIYWEIHAWCHNRQRISTFALDQIKGAQGTGESFSIREAEWSAFHDDTGIVGGLRGGSAVVVEACFCSHVAAYARDWRWEKGLTLTDQSDGTVLLTGLVQGTDGIVKELLRWGRNVVVRGGEELRQAMADEARAIAMLYADKK